MKVPVLDSDRNPLMPCSRKRARKLMERKEAKPLWINGIFTIILQREPESRYTQEVVVGIDPGSKVSGLTAKTEASTLLNIQYLAPTHVKKKVEERKELRRGRRQRKTPYRKCRFNRRVEERLPPSTRARWQQHLNLAHSVNKLYPVTHVVIEDISAVTKKGQRKWNKSFSPLEVGKKWFKSEVEKHFEYSTYKGFDTYSERNRLGLKKNSNKTKEDFYTHCVDSWVLANLVVGGHTSPEQTKVLYLKPLVYHRRKLHVTVPAKKGIRKPYGGTMSLGLKRGTLVKHPKWGKTLVGGNSKGRISLHELSTNKRIARNAKKEDLTIIKVLKWNIH